MAADSATVRVEVLNTGTELLLGNVVNTHAAYFGQALFPMGLRISRQVTVPDGSAIRDALLDAFPRCDVLLVTGGLGPTTDDVTREITAQLLTRKLLADEATLLAIQERCARRGFAFQERMRRQTLVPEGAEVLPNAHGTAPGLYFPPVETPSERTPHLFLLPGPPRELQPMFETHVAPILSQISASLNTKQCRVFRCVGIGESLLEARIGLRFSEIPGLEVGYCARSNEVDFRLIGESALLDLLEVEIRAELGEYLVSSDGTSIEAAVVSMLLERNLKLATAESCTGGLLAHRLTNVAGASAVFNAGWVTYEDSVKAAQLGVDAGVLQREGAVCAAVAAQMALGALEKSGADFALATTGFAGPGGGTQECPVGTVFIGLAERGADPIAWKEFFPTSREVFKELVVQSAFRALMKRMEHGTTGQAAESI